MGRREKKKAGVKLAGFPPVLFSCLRFLNSADPTILEPRTGYQFSRDRS